MKKFISLFMITVLVLTGFGLPNIKASNGLTKDFEDVPKTHTYYGEIMFLKERGIVKDAKNFNPKNNATRQQVVLMVARSLGLSDEPRNSVFKDVQGKTADTGTIQSAYELGIAKGYGDGSFKPNERVTRGHMAAFVARGFEDMIPVGTVPFTMYKDVKKGSTEYEPLRILASAGVVKGYGDNTYRPNEHITREHVAVILARALGYNADTAAEKTDSLQIHQIQLAYNVAALVKTPEGNAFLINTGLASDASRMISYLKAQGIKKLDYVIVSDIQPTSFEGLEAIHKQIPIESVFYGVDVTEITMETTLERMLAVYEVPSMMLEKGKFIKISTQEKNQGFLVKEGFDSVVETGEAINPTGKLVLELQFNDYRLTIGEDATKLIQSDESIIRVSK